MSCLLFSSLAAATGQEVSMMSTFDTADKTKKIKLITWQTESAACWAIDHFSWKLFFTGEEYIVALTGCSTWGENYSSPARYDKAFWNSLIGIRHRNICVNSWRTELVQGLKLVYELKLGWEDARMTASKTCCYFRNILKQKKIFLLN